MRAALSTIKQVLPGGRELGTGEGHPAGHGIAQGEHQPVGRGEQDQPELVGERALAGSAGGGKLDLVLLDRVRDARLQVVAVNAVRLLLQLFIVMRPL